MSALPFIKFTTDEFQSNDKLDAWRQAMAPMFDTYRPETDLVARRGFSGSAYTYLLGPLALGGTSVDALAYRRSASRIRADYIDHYLIRLDFLPERPDGVLRIIDLGQPIELPAAPMHCLCLFVPRDVMDSALPGAESLHGREIIGPRGRLLADHLRSLTRQAPHLAFEDAESVGQGCLALIAACLAPSRDADRQAQSVLRATLVGQVRVYVDANLHDPRLGPEGLCRDLGVSRASLYRAFSPLGGVARYIQRRRLRAAHAALCRPNAPRRISDVAMAFGFLDPSTFARAFRREFGVSASDVAALGRPVGVAPSGANRLSPPHRMMLWGRWMAGLGDQTSVPDLL